MVKRTARDVASLGEQARHRGPVCSRFRAPVLPLRLALRARKVHSEQRGNLRSPHGSVRERCRRRWSVPIRLDAAESEQGSMGMGAVLGPSPVADGWTFRPSAYD